jgi:energy-coupling factor transporter transmembrane protein EcfT
MITYISNYQPNKKLNEKIITLFGNKIGFIINILFSLILISLAITLLYNINNFILSQFLYRTPFLISSSLFIILIINGTHIKLSINPNEGLASFEIPDVNPANTGIPRSPINIYIKIINKLSTKGKRSASRKTTSTCNVNDIPDIGIDI